MVKGISRRVIVVKSPDPKLFDEAIFLVREAPFQQEGVTEEQVLRQARQAANGYLSRSVPGQGGGVGRGPLWLAAGALLSSAVWALALFFPL